jgi:hypothetical protein
MKHFNKVILVTIISMVCTGLYAQKNTRDTLEFGKAVRGDWGVQLGYGLILHHKLNQTIIKDRPVLMAVLSAHYKNYYLEGEWFMLRSQPQDDFLFNNILLNGRATGFQSLNLNFTAGHHFHFNEKWSVDAGAGVNVTQFRVTKPVFINTTLKSEIITGAVLGLGIHKHVPLKRFRYLVSSLRFDFYTTDYSRISPDLKAGSLNINLGIAYKGWGMKQIEK